MKPVYSFQKSRPWKHDRGAKETSDLVIVRPEMQLAGLSLNNVHVVELSTSPPSPRLFSKSPREQTEREARTSRGTKKRQRWLRYTPPSSEVRAVTEPEGIRRPAVPSSIEAGRLVDWLGGGQRRGGRVLRSAAIGSVSGEAKNSANSRAGRQKHSPAQWANARTQARSPVSSSDLPQENATNPPTGGRVIPRPHEMFQRSPLPAHQPRRRTNGAGGAAAIANWLQGLARHEGAAKRGAAVPGSALSARNRPIRVW
jgi:hypothetical protein